MKRCEDYTAALSAFADGELNETERSDLLSHLEQCEACRERLSELMILHAMFEDLPELDAPDGFSERVLERLHEEERTKKRSRRAWPRAGSLLCTRGDLCRGAQFSAARRERQGRKRNRRR